jgi:hypothetical protein
MSDTPRVAVDLSGIDATAELAHATSTRTGATTALSSLSRIEPNNPDNLDATPYAQRVAATFEAAIDGSLIEGATVMPSLIRREDGQVVLSGDIRFRLTESFRSVAFTAHIPDESATHPAMTRVALWPSAKHDASLFLYHPAFGTQYEKSVDQTLRGDSY